MKKEINKQTPKRSAPSTSPKIEKKVDKIKKEKNKQTPIKVVVARKVTSKKRRTETLYRILTLDFQFFHVPCYFFIRKM